VLGSPIAHSRSPALHRAAYAALGLDWSYEAIEVTSAELGRFVAGLGPEWVGLSITMPLKEAALEVAGRADDLARRVGAANTLILGGEVRATNTDVPGLVRVLAEAGLGASRPVERATVLGGGATARSAVVALERLASAIEVLVRSPERAAGMSNLGLAFPVAINSLSDPDHVRRGLGAPIVIDTTPSNALAGLAHHVPAGPGWFVGVAYDPWPTALARAYGGAGRQVSSGFELLLAQAALQVEVMTGRPAPVAEMRAAIATH
jgi:shikimate dehydrogenase